MLQLQVEQLDHPVTHSTDFDFIDNFPHDPSYEDGLVDAYQEICEESSPQRKLTKAEIELVTSHVHVVGIVVSNMINAGIIHSAKRDDAEGDGYMGLIYAAVKFDESMNVKFGTYAPYRVFGEVIEGQRRFHHMQRSTETAREISLLNNSGTIALDAPCWGGIGTIGDNIPDPRQSVEDAACEKYTDQLVLAAAALAMKQLSPTQHEAVVERLHGRSVLDIAAERGINFSVITKAYKRGMANIQAMIGQCLLD